MATCPVTVPLCQLVARLSWHWVSRNTVPTIFELGLMRGHWLAQAVAENTSSTGVLLLPRLWFHSLGLSIQYTERAGLVLALKSFKAWACEMA